MASSHFLVAIVVTALIFSPLLMQRYSVSLHEIADMVFLFITAQVSAHLSAKAALHRQAGKGDEPH